jgi:hypothetical protein
MPIVYVAVGRRLGYPVYLVETKGHLLFRWWSEQVTTIRWDAPPYEFRVPPDRFNVEGSGEGIAYYPDSHYIQWPELWKQSDFEHDCYLRSMSMKESLASFLIQRAECFHELGKRDECVRSIYFARQLVPDDRRYEWLHAKRTKEIRDHEEAMDRMLEMQQQRRSARQTLPGVRGHSPNCQCLHCEQLRDFAQSRPVAPHGPSCQCRHCRTAREAPARLPGHPPNCQCAGCLQNQAHAQPPHVAANGHPTRRMRTPHVPNQSTIAHPIRTGLSET